MPSFYKPHSDKWFRHLEKTNPFQADQTKKILEFAGSPDVCSVCGDPADVDYQILGSSIPENEVTTLRLCPECVKIRSRIKNEKFRAFSKDFPFQS